MELANGVPSHLRTLVAVPTLLTTPDAIEEQIERLEIHHLASPDGDLHFALLSDWLDAATEHAEATMRCWRPRRGRSRGSTGATARRRAATAFPAAASPARLEPRRRRWIGWERKRGKLHELNRLLRGATDTSFIAVDGAAPLAPPDVALRHHARRRYAPAARHRAPADRQDGASAQPAALRRGDEAGRRRLRACCSRA